MHQICRWNGWLFYHFWQFDTLDNFSPLTILKLSIISKFSTTLKLSTILKPSTIFFDNIDTLNIVHGKKFGEKNLRWKAWGRGVSCLSTIAVFFFVVVLVDREKKFWNISRAEPGAWAVCQNLRESPLTALLVSYGVSDSSWMQGHWSHAQCTMGISLEGKIHPGCVTAWTESGVYPKPDY